MSLCAFTLALLTACGGGGGVATLSSGSSLSMIGGSDATSLVPGFGDTYSGTKTQIGDSPGGKQILASTSPSVGAYPSDAKPSIAPQDVGCSALDIGGWTIPVPSKADPRTPLRSLQQPGSRLFYISAATGNDQTGDIYFWDGSRIIDSAGKPADTNGRAYGTDPMNPSAAVKAFRRWAYVGPRQDGSDIGSRNPVGGPLPATRAGYPDWWLFHRGETFDLSADLLSFEREKNPSATKLVSSLAVTGGRSPAERQIVGAYGELCQPRPRFIHPMQGFLTRWENPAATVFKNVAYLSLHFDGHDRSQPAGSFDGITLLYQSPAAVDILFEDLWLDAAPINISQKNGAQVTLRRSLITDAYDATRPQGIYYDGSRAGVLRIDESILLRNGFNRDPKTTTWPPSGAMVWDVFSRNMYLSGETNSSQSGVFDTVSMLGASGDQFRPGMRIERNFFYQGYVSMGAHGGYPDTDGATGTMTDNILQRFAGTGTNSNIGQPGWGMDLTSGAYNVEVARNIVTGAQYVGTGAAFGISPLSWVCYSHTFHYATRSNRIHDNVFESPGNSAPVSVSDGVTGESTPGCSNWSPAGIKKNVVFSNVLINSAGKTSSYEPTAAAIGTTDDTTYTGNKIYASRAAAASALGWSDPNRTLKTYMQANGVAVTSADGFPEYFNAATQMRRGRWQPQWTGKSIVNYFKSGFGMAPLP